MSSADAKGAAYPQRLATGKRTLSRLCSSRLHCSSLRRPSSLVGRRGGSVRRRDTCPLLYDLHVSTDGVAMGESQVLGRMVNFLPNPSANTLLWRRFMRRFKSSKGSTVQARLLRMSQCTDAPRLLVYCWNTRSYGAFWYMGLKL